MKHLAILILLFSASLAAAVAVEGPDIVLIVADDLGYADLSCYGAKNVKTPNIDKLAAEGVRLTQFYANAPECTPTRTALLTGRYQQRVGGMECALGIDNVGRYDDAIRLAKQGEMGLPPSYSVLPSALKRIGYRPAAIGKWHLGYSEKFWPLKHGFEYHIGPLGGGVDYFHHTEPVGEFLGFISPGHHVLVRNDKPYHDDRYMTHLIAQESVDFVKRMHFEERFFLYVPFTAPHTPLQGPNDRREKPLTGPEWNEGDAAKYAEVVTELDKAVGQILNRLDYFQRKDNTVVIFMSDNGPTKRGETGPLSGNKGGLLEGGIRVPCIIRWPKKIKPGTISDQVAISMDLTHSILKIGGVDPAKHKLDGIDIVDHIMQDKPNFDRTLFWRYRRGDATKKAVRDGDLKYIENLDGDKREAMLFDLAADIGEKKDLLDERPEDVKRLRGLLAEWEIEVRPER